MKYRSCKDCPQYEKCVTTSNLAIKRKRCEFADNSRNKKPLTHFDRIKDMSVEEMANLYVDFIMRQKCVLGELERTSAVAIEAVRRDLFVQAVAWLESEVQGE